MSDHHVRLPNNLDIGPAISNPRSFNKDFSQRKIRMMGTNSDPMIHLMISNYCTKGDRKTMEDRIDIKYGPADTSSDGNTKLTSCIFAGVFDGHGGDSCAEYTKAHLAEFIIKQPGFLSDDEDLVLEAIKQGFSSLQEAMKGELDYWPRHETTGLPSTSGTTASVVFIRNGKMFTGHVGDSRIVMGLSNNLPLEKTWKPQVLTDDHKPENEKERERIVAAGGKVSRRASGRILRVVWTRPPLGQPQGRAIIDDPFLSISRSLGDFWSLNPKTCRYAVSPVPDVSVIELDPMIHRIIIIASDGVWGVLNSEDAVRFLQRDSRDLLERGDSLPEIYNPALKLVDYTLERWKLKDLDSDNISVITITLDYPKPEIKVITIDPNDAIERSELTSCQDTSISNSDVESKDGNPIPPPTYRRSRLLDANPRHATKALKNNVVSTLKETGKPGFQQLPKAIGKRRTSSTLFPKKMPGISTRTRRVRRQIQTVIPPAPPAIKPIKTVPPVFGILSEKRIRKLVKCSCCIQVPINSSGAGVKLARSHSSGIAKKETGTTRR